MAEVLLVYSTVDGHTREICSRLCAVIEADGHSVTVVELTPDSAIDLDQPDAVVIGASIRYGRHRAEVARLINDNAATLDSKPGAFFSVNAVARKPEKKTPETNPYVRKFLASIRWQPPLVGIFAGKIDYPHYGFLDKTMIRFIMWLTNGPTDPHGTFEFPDWDAVDEFGRRVAILDIGLGDQTSAVNYGRRYLAKYKDPIYSVTSPLLLTEVRSAKGPLIPASHIQAGERIRILDFPNPDSQETPGGRTFLIVKTEYDHDLGQALISVGGTPDSLAILLAQMEKGIQ